MRGGGGREFLFLTSILHSFPCPSLFFIIPYVLMIDRYLVSWEFHITESNRDYWRVQSLVPPEVGSEALKAWVEAGKAVPWEGMEKL